MTDVTGDNRRIGDVFSFDVPSMHSCTMRVVQLNPRRRIVWRVVKSNMPLFADPGEWVGSDLTFELVPDGDSTRVLFTQVGSVSGRRMLRGLFGCLGSPPRFQSARAGVDGVGDAELQSR